MRNPLWVLTLGLVLLFLTVLTILLLTRPRIPARQSLTPLHVPVPPPRVSIPIDISRIYNNDLLRTYQKPLKPVVPPSINLEPPPPPQRIAPTPSPKPAVTFLDPLKVALKGIISSTDEKDNRAVIADEKTKKEDLYAVGDRVEDAEIIRIYNTKVMFIRSNGQQETLFLTAAAATADPLYKPDTSWESVVQKQSDTAYIVDPDTFKQRVTSLAQFIDMLDLTSAIQEGITIGCRVGQISPHSLGQALGLRYEDVITHINGIPVASTQNRVTAYQSLKNADVGVTVHVTLIRKQKTVELHYSLKKIAHPEHPAPNTRVQQPGTPFNHATPTIVREMTQQDQAAMKNFGGSSALLQRLPPPTG
jgi:type II secretion system protein C